MRDIGRLHNPRPTPSFNALVPKLQLGNAIVFDALLRGGNDEMGLNGRTSFFEVKLRFKNAFPSWSLGTRRFWALETPYNRTRSALLAGIQPRWSFGRAA